MFGDETEINRNVNKGKKNKYPRKQTVQKKEK